MNPEESFVMEAEDVTASFCFCILIACMLAAFFISPRIAITSPLAQPQVPLVPELAIVGTRNPFVVKVVDPVSASIKNGIRLLMRTAMPSKVHALWMVECASLQQALQDGSLQVLHDASGSLQGHFLHHNHQVDLPAERETEVVLTLPDSVTDTVTDTQTQSAAQPSYTKYPLCVFIRAEQGDYQMGTGPQIVGAIYVYHLPYSTSRNHCHLISQLILSDTGQVSDLQKLYMATDMQDTSQNPTNDTDYAANLDRTRRDIDSRDQTNDATMHGCVVCQNEPIRIVLLPCRHACVCWSCFPLLNKCPMCRGCIDSFFLLNSETDLHQGGMNGVEMAQDEDEDWATKFNNSCERLNRWLGIDN